MIRQKVLPCLNNPSRVICFLIFAIGRFVAGAVVGNKAYEQGLLSRRALLNRKDSFSSGGREIYLSERIDDAYKLSDVVN